MKKKIIQKLKIKYKPVFKPIEIVVSTRIDANYFGIKQKLRVIGLDLFKRIRKEDKREIIGIRIKFTLWQKYCIWWNRNINKNWLKYCIWWNNKFNRGNI